MAWTVRCLSSWPDRPVREIRSGANLLAGLRAGGVPIAAPCAAEAVCGRCVVRIVEGEGFVAQAEPAELACLADVGAAPGERLACRVRLRGPISVRATYW